MRKALQVLKELVSKNNSIFNSFSDFFFKGPGLPSACQPMSMCSEEWHHRSELIPSYNNLIITRISIETWNITS